MKTYFIYKIKQGSFEKNEILNFDWVPVSDATPNELSVIWQSNMKEIYNICNDILRVKISRTIIPWQEQPAPKTTTELITMHDTLCWASSEDLSQVLQLPTLSQSIYSTSQKLCTTVSSVTAHKRILDCVFLSVFLK